MSKRAFEHFIGSRTQPASVFWQQHKERWLQAVGQLYANVEGWLDEYVTSMAVVCQREPRVLVEDDIGEYKMEALGITCRDIHVVLDPVGANIIGALGRVDMMGPAGDVRLLLVPPGRGGPRKHIRRVDERTAEAEEELALAPVFKLTTDPPV